MNGIFERRDAQGDGDDHWIPLSDLMTSLMMVFMLVAISFMIEVSEKSKQIEDQAKRVEQIATIYDKTRTELYKRLMEEFSADLPLWHAEIGQNLSVRFKEPDVLFLTGSSEVSQRFKDILRDFFPRYVRILEDAKFKNSITEIRLEGHTSSVWNKTVLGRDAYLLNMELSQARTRKVLAYLLQMEWRETTGSWLVGNLTANGLSSSRRILAPNGVEDRLKSQRVEFLVLTDADARIQEMLRASAK
jgi:outer membrane protein OmpA-like peptidoglycan-associated protein